MTAEELPRHSELEPCELVNGKVVRLSYNIVPHARLLSKIGFPLGDYADKSGLAMVAIGRVGVLTRRHPDTVRAADLVLISRDRYARCDPGGYLDVAPELVIEILSPEHDLWCYVMGKLADYLAAGVDRVWLVDPELRSLFAYRSLTDVGGSRRATSSQMRSSCPGFPCLWQRSSRSRVHAAKASNPLYP